MALPYDELAAVYDVWTKDNDYTRWAHEIRRLFDAAGRHVTDVVDLCCGTASIALAIGPDRYHFTCVDRSLRMLDVARKRVGETARYVESELPSLALLEGGSADAVVCCFDSLNYVAAPDGLEATLTEVSRVLRPGGIFIFDVNSLVKMRDVFGNSRYGDDLDDFAYVWRNRFDDRTATLSFSITLFRRTSGQTFVRSHEEHVQRHFPHDEIRLCAENSGLDIVRVSDDYTDQDVSGTTLRETWVLQKRRGK